MWPPPSPAPDHQNIPGLEESSNQGDNGDDSREDFRGYFPSEVARLVLGYLYQVNCPKAAQLFLKNCPWLYEMRLLKKNFRNFPQQVENKSLQEMLQHYYQITNKPQQRPGAGQLLQVPPCPNISAQLSNSTIASIRQSSLSAHYKDSPAHNASGPAHTVNGPANTVIDSAHIVNGPSHTMNGPVQKVIDSAHIVNSPTHTVNGSTHNVNGFGHIVDCSSSIFSSLPSSTERNSNDQNSTPLPVYASSTPNHSSLRPPTQAKNTFSNTPPSSHTAQQSDSQYPPSQVSNTSARTPTYLGNTPAYSPRLTDNDKQSMCSSVHTGKKSSDPSRPSVQEDSHYRHSPAHPSNSHQLPNDGQYRPPTQLNSVPSDTTRPSVQTQFMCSSNNAPTNNQSQMTPQQNNRHYRNNTSANASNTPTNNHPHMTPQQNDQQLRNAPSNKPSNKRPQVRPRDSPYGNSTYPTRPSPQDAPASHNKSTPTHYDQVPNETREEPMDTASGNQDLSISPESPTSSDPEDFQPSQKRRHNTPFAKSHRTSHRKGVPQHSSQSEAAIHPHKSSSFGHPEVRKENRTPYRQLESRSRPPKSR